MTSNAPYPAFDPNELGTEVTVQIDVLLLPFLIGIIDAELTNPANWSGDNEDVQGTIYAFEELLRRLME